MRAHNPLRHLSKLRGCAMTMARRCGADGLWGCAMKSAIAECDGCGAVRLLTFKESFHRPRPVLIGLCGGCMKPEGADLPREAFCDFLTTCARLLERDVVDGRQLAERGDAMLAGRLAWTFGLSLRVLRGDEKVSLERALAFMDGIAEVYEPPREPDEPCEPCELEFMGVEPGPGGGASR